MKTKASQYLIVAILTFLLATIIAVVVGIMSLNQKEASAQSLSNVSIEDTLNQAGINTKQSNEPTIITENGYKVIKDNDPERQTIIATVISKTSDSKLYTAVNNYDSSDTIVIDGKFSKGDKVMITFFHDDIEKVEVLETKEL
ncbi:hypothetical protein [Niallia taxi]|uniref:hypothetical protein n=1 Tax=Niallia taxi TaxID=2499688 RepID=UPI00300BF088